MVKFCSNCKKIIPIFEKSCPFCKNENLLRYCKDCKRIIRPGENACPLCGDIDTTIIDIVKNSSNNKKAHQSLKIFSIISCIFILFIVSIFAYNNMLWGKDKIVYDLVLIHVNSFKDPSSVRVISGIAGSGDEDDEFENYAFLRLSAKNGFGGMTTGYYNLDKDKISDLEEDKKFWKEMGERFTPIADNYDSMIEMCMNEKQLNVKKINNALKWKLG